MTTLDTDHAIRIEEARVTRRILEARENASRLTEWRGRTFPNAIDVPEPRDRATWPCRRVSIDAGNVTKLAGRKGR